MVRPRCCRTIGHTPPCRRFRPLVEDDPEAHGPRPESRAAEPGLLPDEAGGLAERQDRESGRKLGSEPGQAPGRAYQAGPEVVLLAEELEALRLADAEGLYHEEAAGLMGVSRPTFGRMLTQARRKVASALSRGLGIRIEDQSQSPDGPEGALAVCPRCCRPLVPSHVSRARKGACPHCPKPAGPDASSAA